MRKGSRPAAPPDPDAPCCAAYPYAVFRWGDMVSVERRHRCGRLPERMVAADYAQGTENAGRGLGPEMRG